MFESLESNDVFKVKLFASRMCVFVDFNVCAYAREDEVNLPFEVCMRQMQIGSDLSDCTL